VAFWVIPIMRLGEGERCAPAHDACLVPLNRDEPLDPVCTLASGRSTVVPLGARVLAYGIVDPTVSELEVEVDGGTALVAARQGVVAGLLPEGVTMTRGSAIHIRPFGGARSPIAVLDATGVVGLATDVRARLVDAGLATTKDVAIGDLRSQGRRRSTVFYDGEAFADRARSIGHALGIADVRPAPTEVLDRTHGAAVVVVLGADQAR
jgi:hypothetical protein